MEKLVFLFLATPCRELNSLLLDEGLLAHLLKEVQAKTKDDAERFEKREEQFRERGFYMPSQEERRNNLAMNISLLDRPTTDDPEPNPPMIDLSL